MEIVDKVHQTLQVHIHSTWLVYDGTRLPSFKISKDIQSCDRVTIILRLPHTMVVCNNGTVRVLRGGMVEYDDMIMFHCFSLKVADHTL